MAFLSDADASVFKNVYMDGFLDVSSQLIVRGNLRVENTEIHLGSNAGTDNQGANSVAVGTDSGKTNQGIRSVAIGFQAGQNSQGENSVAVGRNAGTNNQGERTVAIGFDAGKNNQGVNSVAMGITAGGTNQGEGSVAIGLSAGGTNQGVNAVAIGRIAGNNTQGANSVAIGRNAGITNQGADSVAIGREATTSGNGSIAIGKGATTSTFTNAVAIGNGATAGADNAFILGNSSTKVGIGTTNPEYSLEVRNHKLATVAGRFFNFGGPNFLGTFNINIALKTIQGIWIQDGSLVASSDRRIKTNITEINDSSSLDKIRLLKPSYYSYIDTTERTSSVVEGFIAQEVKEVMPYAVSMEKSYIPNIFKRGSYNEVDNIITIDDYDTTTLEYDASNNLFKGIKLYDISDNEYKCEIDEIIASNKIKIQSSEDIPIDIFVYGQEVDNFNVLKKESIFTIGISALQEVDRLLQAEKVKVATLQEQLADVLTRLTTLENT